LRLTEEVIVSEQQC